MMNLTSGISVRGEVSLLLRDATTKKNKNRLHVKNLVVQGGKNLVAAAFAQVSTETVTKIGLGENTPVTPADLAQTALVSPLSPLGTVTGVLNSSPASIVYEYTFGAGEALGDIGEAGLFTATDVLVARTTFTSLPKEANDELIVTWTLHFG